MEPGGATPGTPASRSTPLGTGAAAAAGADAGRDAPGRPAPSVALVVAGAGAVGCPDDGGVDPEGTGGAVGRSVGAVTTGSIRLPTEAEAEAMVGPRRTTTVTRPSRVRPTGVPWYRVQRPVPCVRRYEVRIP
jgi:hypothetical protein